MENLKNNLFEAATQSSITCLQQLLKDDPLILDRGLVNRFNETPLHVAAMLGHVDFVKEIIAIKPQLVNKLNSQGSSCLHLASANGHADVVKALLSVNSRACLDRNRDEMSPLHLAAANGHVEVMNVLLEVQPEAMHGEGGGENILHLCVKRYQLEALKLLVMKSECNEELVNSKDSDGNTALHLAVADKQVETIKFLVGSVGEVVEVNAVNDEGITALDVLIRSRRDLRDSEIEQILKNAGGVNNTNHDSSAPPAEKKPRKKQYAGWIDSKKGSLMVVASLIATIAFQIGVNPPGGVWQDDEFVHSKGHPKGHPHDEFFYSKGHHEYFNKNGHPLKRKDQGHLAGTSVLADNDRTDYILFYFINTTAFVASLSIILLLTSGLPIRRRIFMWILMVATWIAIIAIAISYLLAIQLVTPITTGHYFFKVLYGTFFLWIVLVVLFLITHTIRVAKRIRKAWMRKRTTSTSTEQVGP